VKVAVEERSARARLGRWEERMLGCPFNGSEGERAAERRRGTGGGSSTP
jgi:hypothetical protein